MEIFLLPKKAVEVILSGHQLQCTAGPSLWLSQNLKALLQNSVCLGAGHEGVMNALWLLFFLLDLPMGVPHSLMLRRNRGTLERWLSV